ncbi:MAG: ABC transporter permease, partial [Bacteroidales bacterium]|nr:ABC transporter permease [Bacteroidales bacterium]
MPNNNIKAALRFYSKNKVFAIINGFGLSIAMAVSFIILLYVINELSYDRFNKNGKRIFRVVNFYKDFNITQLGTPYILASTLRDEYPQVEKATTLRNMRGFQLKVNNEFIEIDRTMTANSEIFEIFTFPIVTGSSKEHLLDNMNSLVISQDLSKKLFADENPVGKEIMGMVNNEEHLFIITGVFEDIPPNSTIRASCFIHSKWSIDPINKTFGITNADESWSHDFWTTWIMLSKGSKADDLEQSFDSFGEKYIGQQPHNRYLLQELHDVYLRSDNVLNTGIKGNMKNVRLFSLIALLIILVAAINYIILSSALLTTRSREIGIRKTFGAGNLNIRNQLLSESVLIVLLVLPVALVLTWIALPHAVKLFQTDTLFMGTNSISYFSVYLIIALIIGIASGFYTSTYLSKLQVLDIMKNTANTGRKKVHFRSAMIIVQLLIFCTFVACALTVRSQYKFALSKDTGHYKKDVLQIELG